MDALKKRRVPQRATFTKLAKVTDDEVKKEVPNIKLLRANLITLEEKLDSLKPLDMEVINLLIEKDALETNTQNEAEDTDKCTSMFNLLKVRIGNENWLSTSILNIVTNNLKHKVAAHFWSDSATVIAWMKKCEQWEMFAQNRDLNPADLPSRGSSLRRLIKSDWLSGLAWLLGPL
ncbi:hypothetical protein ILUMI_03199 [Ignelater luminosus]|uniref:Uncharacterized protein n=1 Tax=Ignelater luminosus TaxID=2038154 RepID=A0A8K0DGS8_IGNLU|nr:hypothetical protein ILUMI_03199 [Ignelater luminosus]